MVGYTYIYVAIQLKIKFLTHTHTHTHTYIYIYVRQDISSFIDTHLIAPITLVTLIRVCLLHL